MKISVITVVRNNAATIRDAIDSVLSQTYKDIEYIVVDGVSSDGTIDIVKSYGNKISKFISEPDSGLYDAMNKGIRLATGDVIGILNSDDLYRDKDIIETVASAFHDTDVDAVYGDLVYVSQNDISKVVRFWKSKVFKAGMFQRGWHPAHPTFFVKRKCYEELGIFDTNFRIAADYELMLRFMEKNHIQACYIDKVFVSMRTGGKSNQSLKNIIKANAESYKAWKTNGLKISFFIFFRKPFSKLRQLFARNF